MKCTYCGRDDCQACKRQTRFDILQLVGRCEQLVCKPDEKDVVGINSHLRAVWGLRDAINDYFESSG